MKRIFPLLLHRFHAIPRRRLTRRWSAAVTACLFASVAEAQERPFTTKIAGLRLETVEEGRVTALSMPEDQLRARELARLSDAAAAFFERELGIVFDFRLAVLSPSEWFSPYGTEMPYGIPWCSVAERLIVAPASVTEGALISGTTEQDGRRVVDFVTLHEFGHLAAKAYLHPESAHEELPILWFEELVATYFAYAFLAPLDPRWAEAAERDWAAHVDAYTPRRLSLDWSFMRTLPPGELARTYGWYQNVLNLRVAETYRENGLGFLRDLKLALPLGKLDDWTSQSLLEDLERIAPGFREWADELEENDDRSAS